MEYSLTGGLGVARTCIPKQIKGQPADPRGLPKFETVSLGIGKDMVKCGLEKK